MSNRSFAGTARTLVAVGTVSDWSMFLAIAAAGPRRVCTSSPAGASFTGAALAASVGEGFAADWDAAGWDVADWDAAGWDVADWDAADWEGDADSLDAADGAVRADWSAGLRPSVDVPVEPVLPAAPESAGPEVVDVEGT
ncbi:hypothetical protein GCM10027174_19040 [Salinifilum aidingensis]